MLVHSNGSLPWIPAGDLHERHIDLTPPAQLCGINGDSFNLTHVPAAQTFPGSLFGIDAWMLEVKPKEAQCNTQAR